jgi:hypothetical protein
MAQLRSPVTAAGLIVPVWVGLSDNELTALHAAGQQLPPPLQARGLLDTGSDVTAVSAGLLAAVGISPGLTDSTTTAGGTVPVRLFEVSVSITDPHQSPAAFLTLADLLVMELPTSLPDTEVLSGLDMLLATKLVLDGPAREFTLEFSR